MKYNPHHSTHRRSNITPSLSIPNHMLNRWPLTSYLYQQVIETCSSLPVTKADASVFCPQFTATSCCPRPSISTYIYKIPLRDVPRRVARERLEKLVDNSMRYCIIRIWYHITMLWNIGVDLCCSTFGSMHRSSSDPQAYKSQGPITHKIRKLP